MPDVFMTYDWNLIMYSSEILTNMPDVWIQHLVKNLHFSNLHLQIEIELTCDLLGHTPYEWHVYMQYAR